MCSGFKGVHFSHQGVKLVIGLLIGSVSAIASAPCDFLYLNQRINDDKKKSKQKALYHFHRPTVLNEEGNILLVPKTALVAQHLYYPSGNSLHNN